MPPAGPCGCLPAGVARGMRALLKSFKILKACQFVKSNKRPKKGPRLPAHRAARDRIQAGWGICGLSDELGQLLGYLGRIVVSFLVPHGVFDAALAKQVAACADIGLALLARAQANCALGGGGLGWLRWWRGRLRWWWGRLGRGADGGG